MDESDYPTREAYVSARLAYLRRRLRDMGEDSRFASPETDPELELAFLEQVYAVESEPCVTHAHQLIARGIGLPHPDTLDDEALGPKLWEIIDGLAGLRVFLTNTGHLDDRGLYGKLWKDCLNEFTWDMSHCTNGAMHLDLLGSGSDEDTRTWLRYYADARQRAEWRDQFPNETLPPRGELVCDRDRELPKPAI